MKRLLWTASILAIWGCVEPPLASAQTRYQRPATSPGYRPTISPYLNILRGGRGSAANYFLLTRPQFETGRSVQDLRRDLQLAELETQSQQRTGNEGTAPFTGHQTQFFNYSHYYQFPQTRPRGR